MVSKMRTCVFILLIAVFVLSVELENVKYAVRIGNFKVKSESKIVVPFNVTLFEHNKDQRIAGCLNITRDFHMKYVNVKVHRCHFEKSEDCEIFQNLTFIRHFRRIAYLKNQVWSPLIGNITPKFSEMPLIRKNLYCTPSATLDTKVIVTQYPQFVNYFWRVNITVCDQNDRKPLMVWFDGSVFPYMEAGGKRDRKNITRRT